MRSVHGGRHELGQNFLVHTPTLRSIRDLVAATRGPILELGPGDGALTAELISLGRDLRAIEIDEHRVHRLRRRHPGLDVQHADALRVRFDRPVVVGNIPFHITTPLLRRLLAQRDWQHAVLLTQWEVARKRAGVGGATMMTAQSAPWYSFQLHSRVPAHRFRPVPSVDGGILSITRRGSPLLPASAQRGYERFVRDVFTGRGRGLERIVRALGGSAGAVRRAGIAPDALPRDLSPEQWAALWQGLGER
ncbi:23S ribosomal RNA methyltransferase Erm [Microbacterium sp. NPDC057659]|uniref:23S ribosomal RNA methyltransferase Erm n=1 Tax=Microbacterium sp. NPDC057659 TaxID=3346198 RepID=UPI003672B853